ncbi:MAG: hypothetical protein SGJ11_14860 [Phycisphaerae bacterium]|nr:hypothetical protein [Phycisphaerae bacterium]
MTPFKPWRIADGGAPIVEVGNDPIPDPDVVAFDASGTISGVPGSLLVAGLISQSVCGISAIAPNGTVTTLWESNQWVNVAAMRFDHAGRLLFIAAESDSIWVTTGNTPTVLVDIPGNVDPLWMTIAPDDSIYVSDAAGVIHVYSSTGALIDSSFANLGGPALLDFAPGGSFGTDLYAIRRSTGTLYRVDGRGGLTIVGTGFGAGTTLNDMIFGPCGQLYVARNLTDEVLVVKAEVCACGSPNGADLNGDGSVGAADLALLLGAWGTNDCSADLNSDGTVGAADLGILLGAWGT